MKQLSMILALTGLLCFTWTTANAQEQTEETIITTDSTGNTTTTKIVRISDSEDLRVMKNMVMIDPIKFIGMFNASYYRALTPNFAVGATLQTPTTVIENDVSGVGLHIDGLFYPNGKSFRGFHLGANVSYDMISYRTFEVNGPVERTNHPFSLGGYMGWNWWIADEFATQFLIGAEANLNPIDEQVLFFSEEKGVQPYFAFKIGYAW